MFCQLIKQTAGIKEADVDNDVILRAWQVIIHMHIYVYSIIIITITCIYEGAVFMCACVNGLVIDFGLYVLHIFS